MYKRTDLSVSDGQNNWQTSVNNMKFVNWHLVVLSNDYKLPIFWAYHDMLWEMSCFVSLFSSRDFIITVMFRILIDESRTAVHDEVCISSNISIFCFFSKTLWLRNIRYYYIVRLFIDSLPLAHKYIERMYLLKALFDHHFIRKYLEQLYAKKPSARYFCIILSVWRWI